jgi:hypothetical protein
MLSFGVELLVFREVRDGGGDLFGGGGTVMFVFMVFEEGG